ncbi:glutathione S-transferase family protein [Rhizobium sp. 9140]|uniref:glutathione S-transferase family protein n=1 Tax=Rhizobium sp. 9140 TaxID=1761900 RepID=UPI00079C1BCE|nr:glutathione S-transferase family protein [Rhizobium sp. 9140]CZT37472.1 glutathione S-transferase [Rhizobium sp. 9140]
MAQPTLYHYELDEASYRVRLLLSLLRRDVDPVAVDMFPGQEHVKPTMLALNPQGTLPVLKHDGLVLHGTAAILMYLAKAYDPASRFLPEAPAEFGAVVTWLGFSETALAPAFQARLNAMFATPGDADALRRRARAAFRTMDDHMTMRHFDGQDWFCGDGATLADIALFPSFALSRDYGIDHDAFPALRRWIRRVRALDGFITMPGIPDYH